MFVTPDQEYILSVLQKTRFLRGEQVLRLLHKSDSGKNERYVSRCLRQLLYISRITRNTDDVFTLPDLYDSAADEDMLAAVDIMLDLTDNRVAALSAQEPPFTLRFLSEGEQSLSGYAIAVVPPGRETAVSALLNAAELPEETTVVLLLSDLAQTDKLRISAPHYFVMRGAEGYRYFEGG